MKERINIICSVIEKLFFPLHKKVYVEINRIVENCLTEYPKFIDEMFINYDIGYRQNTSYCSTTEKNLFYKLDIAIHYCLNEYVLSEIEKISNPIIGIKDKGFKNAEQYDGNSFVINIYCKNMIYSFSIALEYIFGFEKMNVLKQNSNQLYCHTIVPKILFDEIKNGIKYSQEYINSNSYKYIGVTKHSCLKRYGQHLYLSKKGSKGLFQSALRGKLFEIGMIEHCIERCGLTRKEILNLEKQEIENRSLKSKYNMGLNMRR